MSSSLKLFYFRENPFETQWIVIAPISPQFQIDFAKSKRVLRGNSWAEFVETISEVILRISGECQGNFLESKRGNY